MTQAPEITERYTLPVTVKPGTATALGLGGVAVAALLIGLLHVSGPTAAISPVDLTISEYGITSSGWIFELAVLILAAASAALFAGLVISSRMPLRSPASVFAALWSAGLVTLVLFPKTPYTATGAGDGGEVHRIASLIAFVSLPIAILLVARGASDTRRWARWPAVASLVWFLPMIAAMAYQGFSGGEQWWTVIPLGLIERGMAATEIAALLVLAWPSRSHGSAAPPSGFWGPAVAGFRHRAGGSPCPPLPPGEWVLVSERDTAGNRQVVATRHALYYQGSPRELEPWHRLGWEQVERADWDTDRTGITLVCPASHVAPRLTIRSAGNRKLLDLARERIAATTLLWVPLNRHGQAAGWLSARRRAGGNGDLRWVLHPAGIELTDEELALAIRQARVQSGL